MRDVCDPACVKNIINTRLIAYIATNLAETAGEGHPLYRPARILAAACRAACEAYDVAIEERTLVKTGEPHDWKGCRDASYLMEVIDGIRSAKRVAVKEAEMNMSVWTDRANKTAANLVRMRE